MSYTPTAPVPVRVILFRRSLLDALHLRLAIDMSPLWCDVHVLEQSTDALGRLRASFRAGNARPEMILFDCEGFCDGYLGAVRGTPELKDLPLVVIGNPEAPESADLAQRHGVTAFVRMPMRASDLAGVGREIARIWSGFGSRRAEVA